MPPKVTVSVMTETEEFNFTTSANGDGKFDIVNRMTGILETVY